VPQDPQRSGCVRASGSALGVLPKITSRVVEPHFYLLCFWKLCEDSPNFFSNKYIRGKVMRRRNWIFSWAMSQVDATNIVIRYVSVVSLSRQLACKVGDVFSFHISKVTAHERIQYLSRKTIVRDWKRSQ
jgi:hypothetical protein